MKNYYFEKEQLHQAIMSVIDDNRTVNCSTVYFYDLDDFIDNLDLYIISCGNGGAFDD